MIRLPGLADDLPYAGIQTRVNVSEGELVMIAVFITHILGDHTTVRGSEKYYIRFDCAGRKDDHPRPNPAIMPHTASQHGAIRIIQLAVAIQGAQWSR
jgi:hypothetical protein